MPDLRPVARARHGSRRWLRFDNLAFARQDATVPLVSHEMQRAVLSLPTAFMQRDDGYALVAVLGLMPGRNLLVAADGRWLGGYIPAAYRSYPFQLAKAEDGRLALCVDEASGLLPDDGAKGEPFFDKDGQLAKPVAEVMEFLRQLQAAKAATAGACTALQEHNLVRPWQIVLKSASGEPRKLQGLFRIDEAALNALPAVALAALRDAGALKLAYEQRLSMQHLPMLGRLAQEGQSATTLGLPLTPEGDLDLDFMNKGGTISFGNLG